MGEMGDAFRAMREEKRERHANAARDNLAVIEASGVTFRAAGEETLVFRERGKPRADFYPSTGRWRDVDDGRTYRGGAAAFLGWYEKAVRDA